ncbi:tRNA dihydrouridine(20/20a) synthase DusA [Leeia sp. TBRC 13508]|uniref:tRNA-dihydrouridine(20/20a) synthase n=1 Tax=Leeia speluncae TaxID=2884804 RepID=A0ABS8D6L2_9NEIS|nr:tRNA dihydrouridine(20/20a) synthase DusA [Leeia speluncae]MCB6183849.1 tRNA dihydrouridine(20/20a) synthase DusA [Leeia speluncae]
MSLPPRKLAIAPMLDWTDRFYRYFARQITKHTWLYTEMVNTGAILHGNQERHLKFDECEHPVALQLGGSERNDLAACAKIAQEWGYDEVNLNVGCPSERVQSGAFGACLMAEPDHVADCLKAMQDQVSIPVTIKHRIGIDDVESYDYLREFVANVAQKSETTVFIVHARNAILKGLSPKENREIPPLKYDYVYRLKAEFPELEILINGGIKTLPDTFTHLQHVDGVMIGREAYHNPYLLANVDAEIYGDDHPVLSREEVIANIMPFVEGCIAEGVPLRHISRHILGLYQGLPGARHWRRQLSDANLLKANQASLISETVKLMEAHLSRRFEQMDEIS